MTNFNTSITVNTGLTFLDAVEYSYQNDRLENIIFYGSLKVDINIITPHYGILSIRIKKFNPNDTPILDKMMYNKNMINFVEDPNEILINQGLNYITINEIISALIYPDAKHFLSLEKSTQFIMGLLIVELVFEDIQDSSIMTREFSTDLIGIIKGPYATFPIP